jgi:hypothetical protein
MVIDFPIFASPHLKYLALKGNDKSYQITFSLIIDVLCFNCLLTKSPSEQDREIAITDRINSVHVYMHFLQSDNVS